MNLLKSLAATVLAAALSLGNTAGIAQAQDKPVVDQVRERGKLRIAGILNEDPYFSKDPRTGEWRGFVVEKGRDLAKTLGVDLEVVGSG